MNSQGCAGAGGDATAAAAPTLLGIGAEMQHPGAAEGSSRGGRHSLPSQGLQEHVLCGPRLCSAQVLWSTPLAVNDGFVF